MITIIITKKLGYLLSDADVKVEQDSPICAVTYMTTVNQNVNQMGDL